MASKQRSRAPKKARAPNPLADLGIFDIPDVMMDNDDESDVDENALESELEAIISGKAPSKPARPKKKAPPLDIERMAAECMQDIDDQDDDEDESVLLDPDLLEELQGLSTDSPETENALLILPNEEEMPQVSITSSIPKTSSDIIALLEDRLHLYNDAVSVSKANNDNSKVRRYGRAVKTLEDLLKSAKSGRNINEEDIPPVVNIPRKETKPQPSETNLPQVANVPGPLAEKDDPKINIPGEMQLTNEDDRTDDCKQLIIKRDQYKVAALQAKRAGDKETALKFIKISKGFDAVIEAIKNGEPVDLSNVPPSPPAYSENKIMAPARPHTDIPKKELQETQTSSDMEAAALAAASEPDDPAMFSAPPAPTSILEALEQRLNKYNLTKEAAVSEGNNSRVRRLQRIIKSYENAIKDYKAGKNIDFEELPTPPGFGPIPIHFETSISGLHPKNIPSQEEKPSVKPQELPTPPKRPAPQVPSTQSQKPKLQRTNTSTIDKQLEFLLERQKLFRQAALAAKKNDDIQQAKEYLRMSKGFDSMIEATKCGLPIDASSIPTPPQLESDFVIIEASECTENEEGSPAELMETLEKDLNQQIEICIRNKEHFLRLGDVSSASKFEKLGVESRKDISVIRHLKKTGGPLPKFHYETRLFSMVQCHTDLADNDLLVTVERGINLPHNTVKPDDLDSYVKLEFPIPSDAPQRAKTHTISDTSNPIFQEEFKFEINRKSRAQLRQFKRQALKLEVWSKGGFLRSDVLLGTASVKLLDLESKCTIHDCFDLMDGRKACGGKLEVKLRIRDPLLVKQVEEVREKWLVIGS